MDDILGFIVVLGVLFAVFGFAALLAAGMLACVALYGLMHVSGRVYTRVTGKSWDDGAA